MTRYACHKLHLAFDVPQLHVVVCVTEGERLAGVQLDADVKVLAAVAVDAPSSYPFRHSVWWVR